MATTIETTSQSPKCAPGLNKGNKALCYKILLNILKQHCRVFSEFSTGIYSLILLKFFSSGLEHAIPIFRIVLLETALKKAKFKEAASLTLTPSAGREPRLLLKPSVLSKTISITPFLEKKDKLPVLHIFTVLVIIYF